MNRRTFISTCLAALSLAAAGHAEPLSLDRISGYFNDLTTAESRFTQYDVVGSRSSGMMYIHRPGRMRFEYDPPDEALVLASANSVAVFDGKSNAPPQQFPLRRTPLNLILARNVDLSAARMVTGHRETDEGLTVITAQDPENPDAGTIELYFSADPVALVRWTLTDEVGGQTTVVLDGLKTGKRRRVSFFSIQAEKARRGF